MQAIIPYLQSLPTGVSVEQRLSELANEAFDERPRQFAALRYYLQFTIWDCENKWKEIAKGVTNYKTLVDRIESRRRDIKDVIYVTFNYDRLLDTALSETGRRLNSIAAYADDRGPKLIKPHGSIHWGRVVADDLQCISDDTPNVYSVADEIIDRFKDLTVTNDFVLIESRPAPALHRRGVVPAIGVPLDAKSTFECPPSHLEALKRVLPKVSRILAIGWRANERHFVQLLHDGLPPDVRALAVNGSRSEAEATIAQLRSVTAPGDMMASDLTFTASAVSSELNDFLAR